MGVVMAVRDDSSASPVLLAVSVAIALSLAAVTALLLHSARRTSAHGPDEERPAPRASGQRPAPRPTGAR